MGGVSYPSHSNSRQYLVLQTAKIVADAGTIYCSIGRGQADTQLKIYQSTRSREFNRSEIRLFLKRRGYDGVPKYPTEEMALSMSPPQKRVAPSKINGVITNIQAYSLHDGPGIRTLVFLKGCPLRCEWCCNPECQRPGIEVEFYDSKCIKCGACLKACDRKAINPDLELKSGCKINRKLCDDCGDCVRACPKDALKFTSKVVSVDEVLEKVKKDRYFYLTSKGGLTISGGEPLYQFEFTRQLLRTSYDDNIDTTIEICGHAPWKYFKEILPYLNLVLYDIKHMDPIKHKQGTGVSNELILSNLTKLSKSGVPIVIRLPLIPHYNLDEDNVTKMARFVSSLENVIEVNLMPFHQFGKDKYRRLSREYSLKHLKALDSDTEGADRIKVIKSTLESYGLNVTTE